MKWFVENVLKVDFGDKMHILDNPHFWFGLLATAAGFALIFIGRMM